MPDEFSNKAREAAAEALKHGLENGWSDKAIVTQILHAATAQRDAEADGPSR
jgi:hypothetical protein